MPPFCVCACVSVHGVHVHTRGGKSSTLGLVSWEQSSLFFWGQDLSVGPGVLWTVQASWSVSSRNPSIHTFPVLRLKVCVITPGFSFMWVLGIKFRSSSLYSKHFTNWILSLTLYATFSIKNAFVGHGYMPIISEFGKLRQENYELKGSPGYIKLS